MRGGGDGAEAKGSEGKVYAKVYRVTTVDGVEVVLAACDSELLGRVFREGGVVLHVNEEFYKGELYTLDEVLRLMEAATVINLVGRRVVSAAIKAGIVHKDAVLVVEGVPHAQVVKLRV